jgi:hypothetical protein
MHDAGLQTSLSPGKPAPFLALRRQKRGQQEKSSGSPRFRGVSGRVRFVVDVPFVVAEEKWACALALTPCSIETEQMCPVAAGMRAPILAVLHGRARHMSRMSHGAGCGGTAKTVVETIPLARAELAATSEPCHGCHGVSSIDRWRCSPRHPLVFLPSLSIAKITPRCPRRKRARGEAGASVRRPWTPRPRCAWHRQACEPTPVGVESCHMARPQEGRSCVVSASSRSSNGWHSSHGLCCRR